MPGTSGQADGKRGKLPLKIVVVLLLACAAVGVGIAVNSGGSRPELDAEVVLICRNPDCGEQSTMTIKELRSAKKTTPASDLEPPAIECPKCHELTAYRAEKCPKCGEYFIPFFAERTASGGRICPNCGVDTQAYRRQQQQQ